MAEKIILEYELVAKGGDKVISVVDDITQSWEESGKAATAALSEKQIDSATEKLGKFNKTVEASAGEFLNLQQQVKSGNALLAQMAANGQKGSVGFNKLSESIAKAKKELKDINEGIAKTASSTRVFDTLVEGGRGVAAAFSVAQGAAALFGEENKDLQKAILKTQGALALLTGVQELAKIATTENGIAMKAYGFAMQVVDKISKVTGLSIAASMAVATAGVTLLVAGVVALVSAFGDSDGLTEEQKQFNEEAEKSKKVLNELGIEYDVLTGKLSKYQGELAKVNLGRDFAIREATEKEIAELKKVEDARNGFFGRVLFSAEKFDEQEAAIKQKYRGAGGIFEQIDLKYNADKKIIDATAAKEQQDQAQKNADDLAKKEAANAQMIIREQFKLKEDAKKSRQEQLEKEIADAKAINDAARVAELEAQKAFLEKQEKDAIDFAQKEIARLNKEKAEKEALQSAYFAFATSAASSLTSITTSFYQQESNNLNEEKQRQLILAGDNAKKREEIEKRFAIKSAEIERKKAIANKAFALTNIAINLAQGISKLLADPALPAAAPLIALTAATAALQTAAILAQPLPEIPKFAKGVIKFKGKGTNTSDSNIVAISNNESVMTAEATGKYEQELQAAQDLQLESLIHHKYVLPILKQAGMLERDSSTYDDGMLRKTLRKGQEYDRENANRIVEGIVKGISRNNYLTQRYFA